VTGQYCSEEEEQDREVEVKEEKKCHRTNISSTSPNPLIKMYLTFQV